MGNFLSFRSLFSIRYSEEPTDEGAFTEQFDQAYTGIASVYSWLVHWSPVAFFWRRWLRATLPHIRGPRILEVSCGTGYLLSQLVLQGQQQSNTEEIMHMHAVDFNQKMLQTTQRNLQNQNIDCRLVLKEDDASVTGTTKNSKSRTNSNVVVNLRKATVEDLPFPNDFFDTVVVTMAFTGYPNGHRAMTELLRVLRPSSPREHDGGQLVMVDINYPQHKHTWNVLGILLVKFWQLAGDIIRDLDNLLNEFHVDYTDTEIGGFGSVHLYVVTKK